jgi:hypothetical protein
VEGVRVPVKAPTPDEDWAAVRGELVARRALEALARLEARFRRLQDAVLDGAGSLTVDDIQELTLYESQRDAKRRRSSET